MRYLLMGIGIAAVAAGASAQAPASQWRYFEPAGQPIQAGVVNAQGAQLIIKCEKPGKKSVYVAMANTEPLVPPARDPFLLPTEMRFDEDAPIDTRWRFMGNTAMAMNARGFMTLERLMQGLPTASKLRLRMYVERGREIEVSFDVTGAQEAIDRVYTSCQDDKPAS
jgi:hypothetical protein